MSVQASDTIEVRAAELISQMTLEEKASLTIGRDLWTTRPIERLGIPSIWIADGPTGVRKSRDSNEVGFGDSVPATCFPTESALAASWDTDLVEEVGRVIARQAQAQGVQILLGPGINLKRSPLAGRNFEYYSEDPVLSGELAAAFITGAQSQGVGSCPKHLVANETETRRMASDSVVDERTLREVYLRPFEIAVTKARPWSLMAAYNMLNGTYCTEHRWLLSDLLRGEWGFAGIVMSDWMAVNDRAAGIAAGLHLQMPGGPQIDDVVQAVESGQLPEDQLDAVVAELLAVILQADAARNPDQSFDEVADHEFARAVAGQCITLLKNDGNLLPLDGGSTTIALIGEFAKEPRIQGWGSSEVVPTRTENAFDELAAIVGSGSIRFAPGYRDEESGADLLEEAQAVGQEADVAVVFVGLPGSYEMEGVDRTHIDLPDAHNALVEAVLAVQPRTIVVLINGSAVAMSWADQAPAIVEAWLTGQAGGAAIADVITGRVNPSGKLAETFPRRLEDTPAFTSFPDDGANTVRFTEGVFSGYRWYDARRIEPLFPFGHGLSFTAFDYSDLSLDRDVVGDGEGLTALVTVTNTGQRAGKEVVQLYLSARSPRLPRSPQELKAFAKVSLEPGESKRVELRLSSRDLAVFDPVLRRWVTETGDYEVRIGSSSRDIRLMGTVRVDAAEQRRPLSRLSVIQEWLDHPAGERLVRPLVSGPVPSPHDPDQNVDISRLPEVFLYQLPIAKLVLMGALTEDQIAGMVAEANRG